MESKKINQLATNVAPQSTDLTIIGDPITGVSKKITWLQVSTLIGTAANLQQVTDNGATTTNPIAIGGLTITGLATGVLKSNSGVIASVPFGAANGVATLGGDGKVPSSQLPSYVDDVVEVANYAALPAIGETGKIYITLDNNKVYRWTGSTYVEIAANNAVWGAITGTLSNQTDLQNALNTKLSSVGLSMPSGFSVANSPLTANGTIAVTGAGNSTQYIDGTGALQTFPTLLSSDNLVKLVRNQSGATMTAGTVIYISGATGNKPLIAKALATGDATSAQTYGIVQANIANNADGYIVIIGNVGDLDTSALTEGQQLYLSATTAGAYTTTKQYAPNHLVYVGIVLRSHPTQGIIGVKIQNGYEMDELHNVAAQSPSNGDILQYVSSTSLWTKTAGTTTNIAEGTNLYFTDTRARNAISLTTTGTSGVATYSGGVLNIPNYGSALSSYVPYTGATTTLNLNNQSLTNCGFISSNGFSNADIALRVKNTTSGSFSTAVGYTSIHSSTNYFAFHNSSVQYAVFNYNGGNYYTLPSATGTLALTSDLSSYIQGSGTTNYVPKFTASGTIGNSLIYDTGTRIAIGGTSATYGVLTVQSDAGQFCIQSNTTPGKQLQIGYDHTTNNSYLSSLNQGVAFTPLALQPNGGNVLVGTATDNGARFQVSGNASILNSSGTGLDVACDLVIFRASLGFGSPRQITLAAGNGPTTYLEAKGYGGNYITDFGIRTYNSSGTAFEVFFATSAGNVGIGTTSPFVIGGTNLTLNNATDVAFTLGVNGTRTGQLYTSNSEVRLGSVTSVPLRFYTADSEKMRITSGGNVGIGTSSPSYKLSVQGPVLGTAISWTDAANNTGYLSIRGAAASIGADNNLVFETGATERMRILLSGGVEIKNISSGAAGITVSSPNSFSGAGFVHSSLTTASTSWYHLIAQSGNGSTITTNNILIYGNGNVVNANNSYGPISDIKLKENIVDASPKLDDLMKVRIVNYNLKADLGYESNKQIGVIAQELEKVFPGLVDENEDIDTEGKGLGTKTKSVKMSVFVPMLIKSTQEIVERYDSKISILEAQIEELKTLIAAK